MVFCNEEKQGFIVSEVMKRSWVSDIEILQEILEFCKKNSINIFVSYGTLLGTVREKGFIPWDDDIDVGFIRDDYVKFLDLAQKELAGKYKILNPYTREWFNMNYTHITSLSAPCFDREYLKSKNGCPFGTGPDVFPYYYIPRNKQEEKYIVNLLKKIDMVIALNRQLVLEMSKNIDGNYEPLNEKIAIILVELQSETGYLFTNERPLENQLEILYDQVCRITEEHEADYVARYNEYVNNEKKKLPKSYFEKTIEMKFEDIIVPVPIGYDKILCACYGKDYLNPKKEGGAHNYPYYSKQLQGREYIKEQISEAEKFQFDIARIDVIKDHSKPRVVYYTGIVEMLIHCDVAISRIKKLLGQLASNNDIEFWWMPGFFPKTDECAWDEVMPIFIKEYEEIISNYINNGGQIYKLSDRIDRITEFFDVFVGDESVFSEQFRKKNKKAVIIDYLNCSEIIV